jgi:hypothetical protein
MQKQMQMQMRGFFAALRMTSYRGGKKEEGKREEAKEEG